jgi:hypothetical protein
LRTFAVVFEMLVRMQMTVTVVTFDELRTFGVVY